MKATLLIRERYVYDDGAFAEMVVWRVPAPVLRSRHRFKYRLAYVERGKRIVGYDNERGKGDHRHFAGREEAFAFESIDALLTRFVAEVEAWRKRK